MPEDNDRAAFPFLAERPEPSGSAKKGNAKDRAARAATLAKPTRLVTEGSQPSDDSPAPTAAQARMLAMMEAKVDANPGHSDSWRSLGRLQKAIGDTDASVASTAKAIEIDPFNAAAQFDYGQLMSERSQMQLAQEHFDRVFAIAPTSSYANQLRAQGIREPPKTFAALGTPQVTAIGKGGADIANSSTYPPPKFPRDILGQKTQPIGYEIQTFDGSDDVERRLNQLESEVKNPANRLRAFLETGVLYNSNVTLTPVSRELAQSDSASFQGFANPDFDWKWILKESTRMGPMFRGYFTVNENDFQDFNLASFQPGAFAEHDFQLGQSEATGRLEYIFANDFFDGNQIGDRHAITGSLTVIRPDLAAFYGYLTLAQSDFTDDGVDPSLSSLDGTTITTGVSRFYQTGWKPIPMHTLGVDLESADTDGADFRYLSINLHGSAGWNISDRLKFTPTYGVGYRDYYDFTSSVPRNELFWRLHGRLQYTFNPLVAVSLVAGHDRFASENENFDTERTEGGVVLTFTR